MSCRHEIFHMINLDRQLDIPVCFLFLYSTINKNLTLPSSPYPSKQQTIVGWPWHDLEFKQTGATVGASFPPPAQHDLIWRHTIHGVPGYSRVEITALYTLPHYIHLEKTITSQQWLLASCIASVDNSPGEILGNPVYYRDICCIDNTSTLQVNWLSL